MAEKTDLTPMMRQYQEIKEKHPDEILFFRLGDFYEMFDSDAVEVSRLLNLTLTRRSGQPMCGIPYHAAKSYLKRLLDAGRKVAICEQLQLSSGGRELARREVVQIYTPGTVVDDEYLDSFSDNYILAVNIQKGQTYTAYCDISTGSFLVKDLGRDAGFSNLSSLMATTSISEVLVADDLYFTDKELRNVLDTSGAIVTKLPAWYFTVKEGLGRIRSVLGVDNPSVFGIEPKSQLLKPIGALLRYAAEMSHSELGQVENIRIVDDSGRLLLDDATSRNLEIVRSIQNGTGAYTLFSALNQTCTAAGSRALKERLLHPDADAARIRSSLDWTGRLVDDVDERSRIRELLSSSADLVRLASKLEMKRSVVRDLVAIRQSLYSFFSLVGGNGSYLELMDDEIADGEALISLADTIGKAINPECTNDRDSGNVILPGFDDELDRLRGIYDHGSALLDDYLEKVRAESGITTLKCSSNRIIGVYLEVPKSQLAKVPDYFIRRQTLVGGERFTTQELSRLEAEINSSQQEAEEKERAIYNSIVARAAALTSDLVSIGRLFSRLDVYQCFATVSSQYGYTRPEIVEDGELEIEDGRHPVVEQHLPSGSFVRNGFSTASSRFALITGPNMAGKSTFLRQNALIILMAHAGCFVPAGKAVIPVCDRIFCRVGSSDNLARGESSFLVEMQESSFILRNAGRHSFVIMDEIGRGTSTQDGMSIAYAIMMYLRKLGCITLFATHYHELTMLDSRDIQLLTLSVRQDRGGIVFLRRIMEGVAESSYGLHVARMAGIPSSVIRDAASFQKRHFADYGMDTSASQLDLFVDSAAVAGDEKDRILDEIADFDVSGSTPLEAMLLVTRLQEELRSSGGK